MPPWLPGKEPCDGFQVLRRMREKRQRMSRLQKIANRLGLSRRKPRNHYHEASVELSEQLILLRHLFLQCQGELVAALRHDPPSRLADRLERINGRLVQKQEQLARLVQRTRHRQSRAGCSAARRNAAEKAAVAHIDAAFRESLSRADALLDDIGRLQMLIRYLARGGSRDKALSILDHSGRHFAPSYDFTPSQRSQGIKGMLVEPIPEAEWQRHLVSNH